VAGTIDATNSGLSFVMSYADGQRFLNAGPASTIAVALRDGADRAAVTQTIQSQLGSQVTLLVNDADDIRSDFRAQLGGVVGPVLVLLAVGVVIGLIGLANALAMAMMERYREIGLLRAIGARRRQLRVMALVESSMMVLVALVIAVPLGLLLLGLIVLGTDDVVFNTIHYHLPWSYLPVVAVTGVVIAGVSSLWPARHAARLEIDSALRFE
jgi:putative ABC transport system permease protein